MVTNKSQAPGKVIKVADPTAEARLKAAREKFQAAKPDTKATVSESHAYETKPDVIAYSFTPKRGENKGKTVSVKVVGFRSLVNPASSYLAVKLKSRDVRAILACIDAGERQELEDLMLVLAEAQQEESEEE